MKLAQDHTQMFTLKRTISDVSDSESDDEELPVFGSVSLAKRKLKKPESLKRKAVDLKKLAENFKAKEDLRKLQDYLDSVPPVKGFSVAPKKVEKKKKEEENERQKRIMREFIDLKASELPQPTLKKMKELPKIDTSKQLVTPRTEVNAFFQYEIPAMTNWYYVGMTDLAKNLTARNNYNDTYKLKGAYRGHIKDDLSKGLEKINQWKLKPNEDQLRPARESLKLWAQPAANIVKTELPYILAEFKVLFDGKEDELDLCMAKAIAGCSVAIARLESVAAAADSDEHYRRYSETNTFFTRGEYKTAIERALDFCAEFSLLQLQPIVLQVFEYIVLG